MKITLPPSLQRLLDPLTVAALLAWVVVWISVGDDLARQRPESLWPVRAALLLFIGGFFACVASDLADNDRGYFAVNLLMALCALFTVASFPSGTSPILRVCAVSCV